MSDSESASSRGDFKRHLSAEVDSPDEIGGGSGTPRSRKRRERAARKSLESSTSDDSGESSTSGSLTSDYISENDAGSKRSLRRLARASMGIDFVPMPPPLPVASISTDDLHIASAADALMDDKVELEVSEKAARLLTSAASKKNMVRRKSLAMMEKLLSKSNAGANAAGILAGPKSVRYSSNFFAQYEDFVSSPLLAEDPLSYLYLFPTDDVSVSVEARDDFQPFPSEERALLAKLPESTQQNATWLLEAYKLFTHANYRVVNWKYAEQGGLYNRCSETSAPGAFAYRVVPKESEKSGEASETADQALFPSSPIFFAPSASLATSTSTSASTSNLPTVQIPVTISEEADVDEVRKTPSSLNISVPSNTASSTSSKDSPAEALTPRALKKEKTESTRSLTPTPKSSSDSLMGGSPSLAGKRGRKKRVASTSVNMKEMTTSVHLLNLTRDVLQRELEIRQQASKVHLFLYYSIRDKTLGINEMPDFSRSNVPHPFEFVGFPQKTQTSIEATGLTLPELPVDEPVFCTLSLHDVAQGIKVSEDFHFELSSPTSLQALDRSIAVAHGGLLTTANAGKTTAQVASQAQHVLKPNPLNMGNRMLVTVTGDVHANYYLILKISRVALPEDQHKQIFAGSSVTSSKRESVQPTPLSPHSIPYFYRVPYAIGAVPLGTSPSSLPTVITNLLPSKAASTYQELYDVLLSEKDLKKQKTIPGSLTLACTRVTLHENTDVQSKLVNPLLEPYFSTPPKVPLASSPSTSASRKDKDKRSKKDKSLKRDKATTPTGGTNAFSATSLEISKETGRSSVIKALQELGPQNRDFMNSHINHLYVLPKRFTLKGGSSKDVQIEIRFKDSDHSPNHADAGLEAFFGSSYSPKLLDLVVSNVCRSDKHVEFTDEFKLKLPYQLGPQHHLLFTFYEVDVKKQKRSLIGYSVLPLLGPENQLALNDTVQALVVHPELPNHYMLALQQQAASEAAPQKSSSLNPFGKTSLMGSSTIQSEMKKRTFLVSTELVSSVYSLNPILSRFFASYRRFPKKGDVNYDALLESVSNLPNVENTIIFKHFPLIFNMLISILCSCVPATYVNEEGKDVSTADAVNVPGSRHNSPPPKSKSSKNRSEPMMPPASNLVTSVDSVLGREAFVALLDLITKVSASTPGKFSSYLRAYLSHMFDNTFFTDDPLVGEGRTTTKSSERIERSQKYLRSLPYEAIVNQINALHQSGNNYFSGFEHGWFLLGLVVKSMALHLADSHLLSSPRASRFSVDYTSKLQAMLLTLLSEKNMRAGIDYTQSVAMFLKDLMGLIDRGAVLTILHDYLVMTRKGKSGPVLETYKFALLKILGNYEHLTGLNVPLSPSGKELVTPEALSTYLAKLRERHPVAGELVHETNTHYIDSATASTLNGAISPSLGGGGGGGGKSPLIRAGTVLGSIPASQLLLELRGQSIIVLRHVLAKHELDPRLQDAKAQQRVASMYFPFMVRLCADPSPLLEMAKSEREEWLISFMYIARNVKRRLLLRWFAMESQKVQVNLWTILEMCLIAFDKITLSRQADLLTIDLMCSVLQEVGAEFNAFASSHSSEVHGQTNPVLKKMVVLMQQLMSKAMTGAMGRGAASPNATRSVSPSSSANNIPSGKGGATTTTMALPLRPPSVSSASGMPVQDEASIGNLFLPMQLLLERCPLACFANAATPGELFGMLLYDFLTQGNHLLSTTVRSFGASMLYLLLTQARHVMGDEFMKVKVDIAVAASKLIGTSTNAKRRIFAPLLVSLASVKKFAVEQQNLQISQSPAGSQAPEWIGKFEDILNHVVKLLEDSSKLEMNVKDPEMMQELYISIEKSFRGSPELRVTWIENLSQLHLDNEDYEEAAECRVHIASMVAQYLRLREGSFGGLMSRNLHADWVRFPFLSPNLKGSEDAKLELASGSHMGAESSTWHSKYLMDQLRQSASLFDKATRYELSLEVYSNMRQYHKMEKKWDNYEKVMKEEQELLGRLVDVNKPLDRTFPVYFRVAFYGENWEHLDGKTFIYKKNARFNLSTFKKQIEEQYRARMTQKDGHRNDGMIDMDSPRTGSDDSFSRSSDQLEPSAVAAALSSSTGNAGGAAAPQSFKIADGGSAAGERTSTGLTSLTYNPADAASPLDLVIMSTNEPVKRETLDPTKSYVQMTGVQPHFESEEMDSRVTRTDQHFAIDRFLFETPFTEDGGKESDDLSKQCKKKTIFRTTHCFPYIKTRLEIIETKEIVLSPIENAIELIKQQSVKLRGELESYPTRLKSLQQVIQGSVVPMVNPGPIKICEIFLSEKAFNSKKYTHKDLRQLCNALNQFVKLCAFAIKLNKANIDASHAKFQAMVEQFHGELEKIVKQCTSQIEKLMDAHPSS